MTDCGNELVAPASKKVKSSSTANHDLDPNHSTDENSSNKETETRNQNVVLLYPNSSCSPAEIVFSVDHILESIFAELDQPTLLNCRLFSRRSLHFSTIFLQKIINFKFAHSYELQNGQKHIVLLRNGNQDRTIDNLITLMNNSTDFPCTSFSFDSGIDYNVSPSGDLLTQRFFSTQGPFIRKLQLEGFLLLSALKQLLLTQAPNLEELIMDCVDFKYSEHEMLPIESEKGQEGQRRRESLFIEATSREKPVFVNLRKLIASLDSGIPKLFQQQLLECSPNLVEIQTELGWLHCLVNPVNRLHLIKKLDISNISEDNIESIIAIANNCHQANWKVKQILFGGYCVAAEITDLETQAPEAVSKILKGCSTTCQRLWWDVCFGDFQIPQMSQVKKFSFYYYDDEGEEPRFNIFPEGASLGDTFPNLKSLEISSWNDAENPLIEKFWGDNGLLGREDAVPLSNVRKVVFSFVPAQNLIDRFREIFPNAVVGQDTASDDEEDY